MKLLNVVVAKELKDHIDSIDISKNKYSILYKLFSEKCDFEIFKKNECPLDQPDYVENYSKPFLNENSQSEDQENDPF